MTSIKAFIVGALFGTFLGATFLGAVSHLLVIGLVVLGGGAAALRGGRRRLSARIADRAVKSELRAGKISPRLGIYLDD